MLPHPSLPVSLTGLLSAFRGRFTAPTFTTFAALAAGFVRQTAAHTVCGMLIGAGLGAGGITAEPPVLVAS